MSFSEQIKKKLTKCYEKKLPVLFYGVSSIDYFDLVMQIHKANGGKESAWEYFGSDKSLNTMNAMADGVKKAIEERDYARMDEIIRDCKSTSSTMVSFDWRTYDCNGLYKELATKEGYRDLNHMLLHMDIKCLGTKVNMFLDFEKTDDGQYWQHSLLERKGLLFIINLFCQTDEDKMIYERLAPNIKDRKDNDHISGDWLVMHTHELKGFPDYFLNQFQLVPLSDKVVAEKPEPEGWGEDKQQNIKGKLSKATYLFQGKHPDNSFHAMVKGDKKDIKLSERTAEYRALLCLYESENKRASVDDLLCKCKVEDH